MQQASQYIDEQEEDYSEVSGTVHIVHIVYTLLVYVSIYMFYSYLFYWGFFSYSWTMTLQQVFLMVNLIQTRTHLLMHDRLIP